MQEAMIEVVKRNREKARESDKDPFYSVEDVGDKSRRMSQVKSVSVGKTVLS
jgi:hypothetical protein